MGRKFGREQFIHFIIIIIIIIIISIYLLDV